MLYGNIHATASPGETTMADSTTTLQELKAIMATFVTQRGWDQFHNPKNISMALAIEAAELMERLQWVSTQDSWDTMEEYRTHIEHELADVLSLILAFANATNIDISDVFMRKMALNQAKYPQDKAYGTWDKNKMKL